MNEHEGEPIRGLPELPPEGEQILWQGEPQWGLLARRVFHVRKVAAYFAAIVLFQVGSGLASGTPLGEIVQVWGGYAHVQVLCAFFKLQPFQPRIEQVFQSFVVHNMV